MENISTAQNLFLNVRKSIRLLYEYQKRMQGTMFHIKSILNLSPAGRIEINKLFSRASRVSKDYGETQLSDVIDDITRSGNHFVVMKFPIHELLTDISISKVLEKVNRHIQNLTGAAII